MRFRLSKTNPSKYVPHFVTAAVIVLLIVFSLGGVFNSVDASAHSRKNPVMEMLNSPVVKQTPEEPVKTGKTVRDLFGFQEGSTETPHVSPGESPGVTPSETPTVVPSPKVEVGPGKTYYKAAPLDPAEARRRAGNRDTLGKRIGAFVSSDPVWQNAGNVGIYIATADRGEVVYSKNANLPMIPASNMKSVTTAAALALLGPEYKFETSVWGGGEITPQGTLLGNLYLRGTGDPTWMYPFTNQPSEVLHNFARELQKKGVKMIEGDLVGDDSAFDREFQGRGWKSRYMLEEYAAPVGALTINGNLVRLTVTPNQVGMNPGNKHMQIIRSASGSHLVINRKPGTDQVTVSGPCSGTVNRSITVNNPSGYTTSVFARVLEVNGIRVKGKVRLIGQNEEYRGTTTKLTSYQSIPLRKIIYETNKESDNTLANHLMKVVGYELKGKGTFDTGNQVIKEWLTSVGVNPAGLALADGSGLSVYNRISPRLMCDMLAYMTHNPHWSHYWSSMPAAGVDGTLIYRMSGLTVRAKTGGISGHIGLSGYVKTKTGQLLVFSILTNNHGSSGGRVRTNEDQVLRIVAAYADNL